MVINSVKHIKFSIINNLKVFVKMTYSILRSDFYRLKSMTYQGQGINGRGMAPKNSNLSDSFHLFDWSARVGHGSSVFTSQQELLQELAKYKKLATVDYLTRLNNRHAFTEKLQKQIAKLRYMEEKDDLRTEASLNQNNESYLFFLDAFDFKAINDILGHKYGDIALKKIAEALKETLRDSDFPARLGGDEFAILITNSNEENSQVLLKRLEEKFNNLTIEYHGQEIKIMVTIGMAKINAKLSAEDNLNSADEAMYSRKKEQGSQYSKANSMAELLARNASNDTVPMMQQIPMFS